MYPFGIQKLILIKFQFQKSNYSLYIILLFQKLEKVNYLNKKVSHIKFNLDLFLYEFTTVHSSSRIFLLEFRIHHQNIKFNVESPPFLLVLVFVLKIIKKSCIMVIIKNSQNRK